MRNILLAATLILALAASTSAQSIQSPMDATAARKTLSNVDAATGRAALGVAASSATVLTSGANAMTGDLKFSGNYGILQTTSDGADNGQLYMCGGGYVSGDLHARGAALTFFGNEYTTIGGQARYYAGNVSTGHHVWYTGNGSERMRLTYGGNLLIGTTTDDGTNKLQVTGNAKITGAIATTGAATVGGDLTVTGAGTNFRNAIKAVDGAGSGLDADTVPNATPASASATGTAGMIRYDANYIYICVAANTWKRAAISTW